MMDFVRDFITTLGNVIQSVVILWLVLEVGKQRKEIRRLKKDTHQT